MTPSVPPSVRGPWRGPLHALLRVLVFLAVAALFAGTTRIADPITTSTEMFHEGEYVGSLWHMAAWQSGKAPFPLLIHGAMDYAPSQIAKAVYGGSRIIGGTRVVNTLIVILTWLVFMELVYQMASAQLPMRRRVALAVALFALLAPPWFSLPVQVTEAFTGVRDTFLLLILLAYAHYWKTEPTRWSPVLAAAGAALLPFAFAWSYDRGIIAIGFTGMMLAGMAWQRRWRDLAAAGGTLLAAAILLERSGLFGTLTDNGRNIFYWITQSKPVWGLPFQFPELNSVLGVLLIVLSLMVAAMVLREMRADRFSATIWFPAGLLVVQLLLAKTSLNRPAGTRVLVALFPSLLLLVHYGTRVFVARPPSIPPGNAGPAAEALSGDRRSPVLFWLTVSLAGIIIALIYLPSHPLTSACRSFWQSMARPRTDLKMVPAEVADLGLKLRALPDPHLFGWCNEGVLQLIARKRWATRFPYAIYAGPSHEAGLLKELEALAPGVMVVRPDAWSMNIDGRSMAERLPAIAGYIDAHFPVQVSFGSYILRQRPSLTESTRPAPVVTPPD